MLDVNAISRANTVFHDLRFINEAKHGKHEKKCKKGEGEGHDGDHQAKMQEIREKIKDMTPEERKEFFQKMRDKRGGEEGSEKRKGPKGNRSGGGDGTNPGGGGNENGANNPGKGKGRR